MSVIELPMGCDQCLNWVFWNEVVYIRGHTSQNRPYLFGKRYYVSTEIGGIYFTTGNRGYMF